MFYLYVNKCVAENSPFVETVFHLIQPMLPIFKENFSYPDFPHIRLARRPN